VARQDAVLPIQQNRVGEAELLDAAGDLPDLLVRVRARVARVRPELYDWTIGDGQLLTQADKSKLGTRLPARQMSPDSRPLARESFETSDVKRW
jgi:hypothetical protein